MGKHGVLPFSSQLKSGSTRRGAYWYQLSTKPYPCNLCESITKKRPTDWIGWALLIDYHKELLNVFLVAKFALE